MLNWWQRGHRKAAATSALLNPRLLSASSSHSTDSRTPGLNSDSLCNSLALIVLLLVLLLLLLPLLPRVVLSCLLRPESPLLLVLPLPATRLLLVRLKGLQVVLFARGVLLLWGPGPLLLLVAAFFGVVL